VQGWRGSRVVFALGIGAASVAALFIAGIFTYRELVKPDKGIDWVPSQRAVASVTSPAADGGAFLVESNGELWLVTTLDLVAGATEISATFRDPANGAELLRLAGIRSKDMWVDRRLFVGSAGGTETDRNAPYFAVAAANVEMYRPQIEALAIEPLEIAEQSDVAMGAKIVALGQVTEQGASQAPLHALFDGTVSFIKTPNKGPAYLQTSARFEDGCIGGPLLLESTREIVGVQLDPFVSSYRRLAIMGDEIHEVLENGIQLGGVRKALESVAGSIAVAEENVELSDLEDGRSITSSRKSFSNFKRMVGDRNDPRRCAPTKMASPRLRTKSCHNPKRRLLCCCSRRRPLCPLRLVRSIVRRENLPRLNSAGTEHRCASLV